MFLGHKKLALVMNLGNKFSNFLGGRKLRVTGSITPALLGGVTQITSNILFCAEYASDGKYGSISIDKYRCFPFTLFLTGTFALQEETGSGL